MSNQEQLIGKVKKIIYKNKESNYYILSVDTEDDNHIVLGNFDNIDEYIEYEFEGIFTENAKYGVQFKAHYARMMMPKQKDLVVSFLSSNDFVGIGKILANKIYQAYEDEEDVLKAIACNSDALQDIKGLTKNKIKMIVDNLNKHAEGNGLFQFLKDYHIDYDLVFRLFNKAQLDIDEFKVMLLNNPYLLMKKNISYKEINRFAHLLNLENYEYFRNCGLLLAILKEVTFKKGATYLTLEQLFDLYIEKSKIIINSSYFDLLLEQLYKEAFIIVHDNKVYEKEQYEAEYFISEYIKEYNNKNSDICIDELLSGYENKYGIIFNDEQKKAISNGINCSISLITGGPGTGKSTIVDALLDVFNELNRNYKIALCAPTGKASKRLAQLTNRNSTTIHKLLKWDMNNNSFGYNVLNPLDYDVLICDEFSMVDNILMASLLKASLNVKQIIILGDYNQLPSVGQGQVLKDLIDSNKISITFLKRIYRQKEGSKIIDLAYQTLRHLPIDLTYFNEEINFIDVNDNENIMNLLKDYLNKINNNEDVQILAPIYRGNIGIDRINYTVQHMLFPNVENKYHEGDLVLQLKNRSDVEIYNGDMGSVLEINNNNIKINYDDKNVDYSFMLANEELTLAYCISIHKAQGNEYDEVIIFLPPYASHFVDNKILYTAITRAKKKLTIVSSFETINQAILNHHAKHRQTNLKNLIIDAK
jgi:exodeoxyribonuclease V alpha subunit